MDQYSGDSPSCRAPQCRGWRALPVFGDLLVVLKLAFVTCEESGSKVADADPPTISKKFLDHHGLVDVRHPHPVSDEISEMFK